MDENIGDGLRVTMVATGLNSVAARRAQKPELRVMTQLRDGTTNQPIYYGASEEDSPSVFTSNNRRAHAEAMKLSGVEEFDIPTFLRKQAD
jgi:cell division protein FtsZ